MSSKSEYEKVKEYFDDDSSAYLINRYPSKAKTCAQQAYNTRKKYVLELLDKDLSKDKKILDIGCGPAVYSSDLLNRGYEVWGLDISDKMIEKAKELLKVHPCLGKMHFRVGVPDNLEFEDNYFDEVIAIGIVAYIEDIKLALSEINRVLKPGGRVIFQFSTKYSPDEIDNKLREAVKKLMLRNRYTKERDFILRHYRPKTFNRLCQEAGFNKVAHRYYAFYTTTLARFFPAFMLKLSEMFEKNNESNIIGMLGAGYVVEMKKNITKS